MNEAVQEVLDDPSYERLELRSTHVEFGGPGSVVFGASGARTVTVELGRPADEAFPALADRIERAAERRSGRVVSVEVTFTDRVRSTDGEPSDAASVRAGQSSLPVLASRSPSR